MKNKIIYIEWVDAASDAGWHFRDSAEEWAKDGGLMVSCGIFVTENKDFICIATTEDSKTNYNKTAFCNLQKIPKKWIKKRKFLSK